MWLGVAGAARNEPDETCDRENDDCEAEYCRKPRLKAYRG